MGISIKEMRTEVREGRNWRVTRRLEHAELCAYHLASDLYEKKILGSSGIQSIRRKSHGDGRSTLTVTMSNGWRNVYEITSR